MARISLSSSFIGLIFIAIPFVPCFHDSVRDAAFREHAINLSLEIVNQPDDGGEAVRASLIFGRAMPMVVFRASRLKARLAGAPCGRCRIRLFGRRCGHAA